MKNIDSLELSRMLREETSRKLSNLSSQEKLELFEAIKDKYKDKIIKNNILEKTAK